MLLDSSFFNPLQLQPIAIGRLGFNAGARWLKQNVCSHRKLIWGHGIGLVLWAWELQYLEPLSFRAADEARLEVTGRVRGPSSQFECEMKVSGPEGVAVEMRAISLPLSLAGDAALSGRPQRLPNDIVDRFLDDEIDPVPYRSSVAATRTEVSGGGRPLAKATEPFRVHRHNCEVADQWFWAESLGFAAAGREELVARNSATCPEVREGLRKPVSRIEATCSRTYQFRDLGSVSTTAYEWNDSLVFLHDLCLAGDGCDVHATAIEQF